MPTTKRDGLPSFWSTHLAKVLVGDQPCQLAAWLPAHYKIEKRPREDEGSLVTWKANHSAQLRETVERFEELGWKCSVERFFRVTGKAAILSGKADLIAQQTNKRPLIVDVKSGNPRDSDAAQVMVEMCMIPLAWNSPGMIFDGQVIYPTHSVNLTPAQAAEFKPRLFAVLKKLGTMGRPQASPSQGSCRFCDISEADCPDRVSSDTEPAVTTEF